MCCFSRNIIQHVLKCYADLNEQNNYGEGMLLNLFLLHHNYIVLKKQVVTNYPETRSSGCQFKILYHRFSANFIL